MNNARITHTSMPAGVGLLLTVARTQPVPARTASPGQ